MMCLKQKATPESNLIIYISLPPLLSRILFLSFPCSLLSPDLNPPTTVQLAGVSPSPLPSSSALLCSFTTDVDAAGQRPPWAHAYTGRRTLVVSPAAAFMSTYAHLLCFNFLSTLCYVLCFAPAKVTGKRPNAQLHITGHPSAPFCATDSPLRAASSTACPAPPPPSRHPPLSS